MQSQDTKNKPPALNLNDILFAIFKHKWKILALGMAGLVAAGITYKTSQVLYESRSKIMVRYVLERSQVDTEYENRTDVGGRSGAHLVGAEVELLTSWDIAKDVVEQLGVEAILPNDEKEPNPAKAAGVIAKNLRVVSGKGSNVIHVSFQHPDPNKATVILGSVIDRYFVKHLEIHRNRAGYDYVSQKTDSVRSALKSTETALDKLKATAGILSVAGEIASLTAQRSRIREDLLGAQVDMKAQEAMVKALQEALAKHDEARGVKAADAGAAPLNLEDPAEAFKAAADYRALLGLLGRLQSRDLDLRTKFAAGNRLVAHNSREIARVEAEIDALLAKHPALLEPNAVVGGAGPVVDPRQAAALALINEQASLMAMQARLASYQEQKTVIEGDFQKLMEIGSQIEDLERRRLISDENYKHFAAALERAKVDEALNPETMPNISYLQRPSNPVPTRSSTRMKLVLGLAASGFALGIGLALLLELVIDGGVKRPGEIESRLRIPLLMSIPRIGTRDARKQRRLLARREAAENGKNREGDASEDEEELALAAAGAELNPLASSCHFVHPYADGIRDRLVYYFELNNMTHKPKLIALTGLNPGAGTSTLAAGLARSFAEESAKVLLVDLNARGENGSDGKPGGYSLTGAAREGDEVGIEDVGDNLFLASMPTNPNGNGGKRFAARQFYDLIPRFRRSQFDYIIFDMPPLDGLSPTTAMAGFMDQILLVLDAQNTNRNALTRGYSDLARGSADVTCIFNKTRSHAPSWVAG